MQIDNIFINRREKYGKIFKMRYTFLRDDRRGSYYVADTC